MGCTIFVAFHFHYLLYLPRSLQVLSTLGNKCSRWNHILTSFDVSQCINFCFSWVSVKNSRKWWKKLRKTREKAAQLKDTQFVGKIYSNCNQVEERAQISTLLPAFVATSPKPKLLTKKQIYARFDFFTNKLESSFLFFVVCYFIVVPKLILIIDNES